MGKLTRLGFVYIFQALKYEVALRRDCLSLKGALCEEIH